MHSMVTTLSPQQIEVLAHAQGLSIRELCRRAGVAQTTFTRWKKGDTEPLLSVYRRLVETVFSADDRAA